MHHVQMVFTQFTFSSPSLCVESQIGCKKCLFVSGNILPNDSCALKYLSPLSGFELPHLFTPVTSLKFLTSKTKYLTK